MEWLTAECGGQSFPKHLTQEHIDERVQTYISGRQPQGGFLGDVERVLCMAVSCRASGLGQSIGNAGKVKGGKADEKHAHHHKHLCLSPATCCMRSAL